MRNRCIVLLLLGLLSSVSLGYRPPREWVYYKLSKDTFSVEKQDVPALRNCGFIHSVKARVRCARYYVNPSYIGETRAKHDYQIPEEI